VSGGDRQTVLITGAAGNLGSLLARHLLPTGQRLRLMEHRKPVPADLSAAESTEIVRAGLGRPETLAAACAEVDTIVHFAGVLCRAWPARSLRRHDVE